MKFILVLLFSPAFLFAQEIDKDSYDEFSRVRTILTKKSLIDQKKKQFPFYVCAKSIEEKLTIYSVCVFFMPTKAALISKSTSSLSFLFTDKTVIKIHSMLDDSYAEADNMALLACQLTEEFLEKVKNQSINKIRVETGTEQQDFILSETEGIRLSIELLDKTSLKPHPNQ